jgi:hypothetical protein
MWSSAYGVINGGEFIVSSPVLENEDLFRKMRRYGSPNSA